MKQNETRVSNETPGMSPKQAWGRVLEAVARGDQVIHIGRIQRGLVSIKTPNGWVLAATLLCGGRGSGSASEVVD
jgi:hypothetical protein